jgi:hypothetical protein
MSTSIPNGFRLPSTMTLEGVFEWVKPLRNLAKEKAEESIGRELLANACEHLDKISVDAMGLAREPCEQEGMKNPLAMASDQLRERLRQVQRERRRDCEVDTETSIIVIPHTTGLYGLLSCENELIRKAFFSLDDVEHLPYWNNTDQPDGLSQEQWNERGRLWDELLPSGVPSESGASFMLHPEQFEIPYFHGRHPVPKEWLPDFTKRVFDTALLTKEGDWLENVKAQTHNPIQSLGRIVEHLDFLREGKDEAFNAMASRLGSILVEYPSAELLTSEPAKIGAVISQRWLASQSPMAHNPRSGPRL